jgi:hypothetical protein
MSSPKFVCSPSELIEVRQNQRGRGVFAKARIREGDIVEESPMLVIPSNEWQKAKDTLLYEYVFPWGNGVAIALGYGSLFNHKYEANVEYVRPSKRLVTQFIALREIEVGEELFINYNGDPYDKTDVGFTVKGRIPL